MTSRNGPCGFLSSGWHWDGAGGGAAFPVSEHPWGGGRAQPEAFTSQGQQPKSISAECCELLLLLGGRGEGNPPWIQVCFLLTLEYEIGSHRLEMLRGNEQSDGDSGEEAFVP